MAWAFSMSTAVQRKPHPASSSHLNRALPRRQISDLSSGGEQTRKIKRQEESRTTNALVFLGIMTLFFLAAMVKIRHHDPDSASSSLRSHQKRRHAAKEDTLKEIDFHHKPFVPPDSIYSLTVPDITGSLVSLDKFRGMVTLVVNVACL